MFKVGDRVRFKNQHEKRMGVGAKYAQYPDEFQVKGMNNPDLGPDALVFGLGPGAGVYADRLELIPEDPPAVLDALVSTHGGIVGVPSEPAPARHVLPQDDETRKAAPMYRGLIGYFARALFEVAAHSLRSDLKHNPHHAQTGEGPFWARGKSSDHEDCIVRHLAEMHPDPDVCSSEQHAHELYHRAAIAWRGLAQLQEFLERTEGARPGASSR